MSVIGKNPKPRARPVHMGWRCSGLGVTGYGMTLANAYASWEQRWLQQWVRSDEEVAHLRAGVAAQHYSPWVAPNVEGKPFSPEPL